MPMSARGDRTGLTVELGATSRVDAFLTHMGLREWYGADLDWHERGVERTAQVIAWGLMDELISASRLGDRPCGQLSNAFRLITKATPLRGTCDSRGTDPNSLRIVSE